MMRIWLWVLLMALGPAMGCAQGGGFTPPASPASGGIHDLALIYQGGTHRLRWTTQELQSYVSWTDPAAEKEQWLFDGFLFIEFKTNEGHELTKGYGAEAARRAEWEWYLERVFEPEVSLHALDRAVSETAARIGPPPCPRRVVLTLPTPIYGQKDWGELDGKALDFNVLEDRLAASRWFMGKSIENWNAAGFKNLQLAGFYWVDEHELLDPHLDLMRGMGDAVRAAGYRFYWIPCWQSPDKGTWRDLGFDAACQQPNHFFREEIPDTRLDEACQFALARGMGMEMEWDERVYTEPARFAPRLQAYLDAYDRHGVHSASFLAHYTGGAGMIGLAKSTDPAARALYERYCRTIVKRQAGGQ